MNAADWVKRALKEASRNRDQAGAILLRYFQAGIDEVMKDAGEILMEKEAEIERLKALLSEKEREAEIDAAL